MTDNERLAKLALDTFDVFGKQWMLEAMTAPFTEEGEKIRREAAMKYQLMQNVAAGLAAKIKRGTA